MFYLASVDMCPSDSLKERQKVLVEKVLWGNPDGAEKTVPEKGYITNASSLICQTLTQQQVIPNTHTHTS